MKNKKNKKTPIPKEDYDKLMKMKASLLKMKKMLNDAKKEAEKKEEENNILIFRKD